MSDLRKKDLIEIVGIILVADRDRQGNVIQVLVITDDFKKYILNGTEGARALFNKINQPVKITGKREGEDIDGNIILNLSDFKILKNNKAITK